MSAAATAAWTDEAADRLLDRFDVITPEMRDAMAALGGPARATAAHPALLADACGVPWPTAVAVFEQVPEGVDPTGRWEEVEARQAAMTRASLSRRFVEWSSRTIANLVGNIHITAIAAAIGFGIGWLGNVSLMGDQYDGFRVPAGSAATGDGNLLRGTIFWFFLSATVSALVAYRMRVGSDRFWDDVKEFPDAIRTALAEDGDDTLVHLLIGFAGSAVVVWVVGPSISALFAVGALLLLGRALRSLATVVLMTVWRAVAQRVAPRRSTPPPAVALVVGVVGSASAFAVGTLLGGGSATLALGIVAGIVAVVIARNGGDVPDGAAGLLTLAGVGALLALGADIAWADDGGFSECGNPGLFGYIFDCTGSSKVLGLALVGGTASAAGAAAGAAGAGAGGGPDGGRGSGGGGTGPDDDEVDFDALPKGRKRKLLIEALRRENPDMTAEQITTTVDNVLNDHVETTLGEEVARRLEGGWNAAVKEGKFLWENDVISQTFKEIYKDNVEGDMLWRIVEAPLRAYGGVGKAAEELVVGVGGGIIKGGAYVKEHGPELAVKGLEYISTHSPDELIDDFNHMMEQAPDKLGELGLELTDAQISSIQHGLGKYQQAVLDGDPKADQMLQDVVGQAGFDALLGMGMGKALEGGKGWMKTKLDPEGIGTPRVKQRPDTDGMSNRDWDGNEESWKDLGGRDKPGTMKETDHDRLERKVRESNDPTRTSRTRSTSDSDPTRTGGPADPGGRRPKGPTSEDVLRAGAASTLKPEFDGPSTTPDGGSSPTRRTADSGSAPPGYDSGPSTRRPSTSDTPPAHTPSGERGVDWDVDPSTGRAYPKARPTPDGVDAPAASGKGARTGDPLDAASHGSDAPPGYGPRTLGTAGTPDASANAPSGYGPRSPETPTSGDGPSGYRSGPRTGNTPDGPDGGAAQPPGGGAPGYDTRPGGSSSTARAEGYDTLPGSSASGPDDVPDGYTTRAGDSSSQPPAASGYTTRAGDSKGPTETPAGYDTKAGGSKGPTDTPSGYRTEPGGSRAPTPEPEAPKRPRPEDLEDGIRRVDPVGAEEVGLGGDRMPGETDAQYAQRRAFEDDVRRMDPKAAEEAGYDTSDMYRDNEGDFDGWKSEQHPDDRTAQKIREAEEPTAPEPDRRTLDVREEGVKGEDRWGERDPSDRLDLEGKPWQDQAQDIRAKANDVQLEQMSPEAKRQREELMRRAEAGDDVLISHEQAEKLFGVDKPIIDQRGNTILQGSEGAAEGGISSSYKLSLTDDTTVVASKARQQYDDIWTGKWNTTADKGFKPGEEALMPDHVRDQFAEHPPKPGETINYTPRDLTQSQLDALPPHIRDQYFERKDQAGAWDAYHSPETAKIIDYSDPKNSRYGPMWVAEDTSGPVKAAKHWHDPTDGRIYVQYQTNDGVWHPPKRQISDVDTVTHQGSDREGYDYDSQRDMQYQQARGQLGEGDSANWGMSMVDKQPDGSFVMKEGESPKMFYKALDAVYKAKNELVLTQDLDGVRLTKPEIPQYPDMVRAARDMDWTPDQVEALKNREILPRDWPNGTKGTLLPPPPKKP